MTYSTAAIYRRKRTGTFLVQSMAHVIGGSVHAGPPVTIEPSDFDRAITPAVMAALDSYVFAGFDESKASKFSDSQWGRFLREHEKVSVTTRGPEALEVLPMHRVRGG
jgi:hypothetical protein